MGISGISPGSLLLILVIVILLFGPKNIGRIGKELGKAVKNFQSGLKGDNKKDK